MNQNKSRVLTAPKELKTITGDVEGDIEKKDQGKEDFTMK